jgi:hypothetical protein
MTHPHRVQLRRVKGWRKPPGTVVCTRGPGRVFGNPFVVGVHGDAAACVARFRDLLTGLIRMYPVPCPPYLEQAAARDAILARLPELRGKNLACWCALDQPCHVDFLLELANG